MISRQIVGAWTECYLLPAISSSPCPSVGARYRGKGCSRGTIARRRGNEEKKVSVATALQEATLDPPLFGRAPLIFYITNFICGFVREKKLPGLLSGERKRSSWLGLCAGKNINDKLFCDIRVIINTIRAFMSYLRTSVGRYAGIVQ